ncbi:MAG: helix-turn-helix transcriptional regulator [Victivallales bacterium]|nr:helix-turn-helix transcriptional regulator [Bacteroidales bacterium]MBO7091018.1 helix-turn-helix transcriptional regulator [Victivallales bacterium]
MTQEEAIARLSRYQSDESSEWMVAEEKIRYAKEKGWLQYSRKIAIKVAVAMKQQGLSRQNVADRMGCTPQYISKLLKGTENLSLETICKLEDALNISILQYEFA